MLAGGDLDLQKVSYACNDAVAAGCALYLDKNASKIKALDATNASHMSALVSGFKTMEAFGFVGQYDSMCKASYAAAQKDGTAADWNNNRCDPDPLISCLSATSRAKIPSKFKADEEACSIVTVAKRLQIVDEFIEGSASLP